LFLKNIAYISCSSNTRERGEAPAIYVKLAAALIAKCRAKISHIFLVPLIEKGKRERNAPAIYVRLASSLKAAREN
jgi:hypothetical protein